MFSQQKVFNQQKVYTEKKRTVHLKRFVVPAKGVALISVLLIVAILLAVASRIMANHNLLINSNQNTFEQNQALNYALGAETLARQALIEDITISGPDSDHLGEFWAQDILPFELDEGGYLEAQLVDLHRCFNFNVLQDSGSYATMGPLAKQFLTDLGVDPNIADHWKDWVDADVENSQFGAEENEYLVASPPHRTPNDLVTSKSEFFLLQNVEREHLSALLPHICLLPTNRMQININTASAVVLASLDVNISLATTEQIVAAERNFKNVAEFISAHQEFAPVEQILTVSSDYFALHAQAQVGEASVTLYSLLQRDDQGNVTVLGRDFGKLFQSRVQAEISET